jgi:hypothetical protein
MDRARRDSMTGKLGAMNRVPTVLNHEAHGDHGVKFFFLRHLRDLRGERPIIVNLGGLALK